MPLPNSAACAMNGDRYLLDTNAIVALLRGDAPIVDRLKTAEWVGISVISQIEFLAFTGLSDYDRALFAEFLNRSHVVGLTGDATDLINQIVQIRQVHRLKLPDAIIAASALQMRATLLTADQQLHNVASLKSASF